MTTPILRQSSRRLLARLLEEPNLDEQLTGLTTLEWKAVVSAVGLEDSGELLCLATEDQLLEIFDEELWFPDGASGETIDVERFATTLEVLAQSGVSELARKLSALSEDFLRLAFGSLVTVWSYDFLARYAESDDDDQLQKRLEGAGLEEFGEYLVISTTGLGWDAVVEVFATWNEVEPALLDRILSSLAAASEVLLAEHDDLFSVLDGMEEIRQDAEAEREDRRAAHGYVSLSDARAFLKLPAIREPVHGDALSRAYLRRLRRTPLPDGTRERGRALDALLQTQRSKPRAPLESDNALKSVMQRLQRERPEVHERCVEELSFLVNVVVADSRSRAEFENPAEALRRVAKRIEQAVGAKTPVASEGSVKRQSVDPVLIDQLFDALVEWGAIGLFRRDRTELGA